MVWYYPPAVRWRGLEQFWSRKHAPPAQPSESEGPLNSILWLLLTLNPQGAVDSTCVKHILVPGYPHLARAATLQGTVTVEVDVDSDGNVASKRSSGANELLQRASEANVAQWKFCPASGATGARKHSIIYIYKLEGPKEYPVDSAPIVSIDLPNRVEIVARPPKPMR
jgi:TonB family protein